ncbi:MAG: CRISPR-associated endonuclease Cas2 [Patescibacteria group bacterium]|nr:CRISPR-associated endonuclease Cas2 [Patescibacteria group bacterium]
METHKVKRQLKRVLIFSLAFIYDQYQKMSIKSFYRMLYMPGYGSRKSFLQLLSRSEKIGDIKRENINGDIYLKLTSEAGSFFNEKISLKKISEKEWDGYWRLVIFDINETAKSIRDGLRKKLKQLGFSMWQESVYITPHPIIDEINEYLKTKNLFPKVICLEAKTIGVKNHRGFAWIIYNLKSLNEKYLKLINLLNLYLKDFKSKKINKKEFLKEFKEIFQSYQELVISDPFLPKGLEPENWPREKLKRKILKIIEDSDFF